MKYFKITLLLLWRFWFYLLLTCTILLIVPILLILTAKQSYYPILWNVFRAWAKVILYGMGFRLQIQREETLDRNKSYMFCPNHTSLLDPFILIVSSKNPIVFVGKQSLEKIPVFGFFYKKIVIMVDRSNPESRKRVFKKVKERLQNGISVAIFPEGLVPEEHIILAPFKRGAFSLAIELQIPIVPQTYYDAKRFFSWDIFKGRPGLLRVKQHQFIETKNLTSEQVNEVLEKTYATLKEELSNDEFYMKDTNRKPHEKRA